MSLKKRTSRVEVNFLDDVLHVCTESITFITLLFRSRFSGLPQLQFYKTPQKRIYRSRERREIPLLLLHKSICLRRISIWLPLRLSFLSLSCFFAVQKVIRPVLFMWKKMCKSRTYPCIFHFILRKIIPCFVGGGS